jgi:hypothetical protein
MFSILKNKVTSESIKEQIKKIQSFLDSKEIDLEKINDMFIEIGLENRPSLEEFTKKEILEEISYQIEEKNSSSGYNQLKLKGYEVNTWFLAMEISSDFYQRERFDVAEVEKILNGIKYHDDEFYKKIIHDVTENLLEEQDKTEEFRIIMQKSTVEIVDSTFKNLKYNIKELDDKLKDYEIDTDDLKLGDIKFIYNNLATELGEEPKYTKDEIIKDILNEIQKNKEKEVEKEF